MKPLFWIGTSKRDIRESPPSVRKNIGDKLFMVQDGLKPPGSKPLTGFGSANVREIVENDRSGTYRAVYTLEVKDVVYVLHVFKKKATKGKKTAPGDIATIKARLKEVRP